MLSSKVVQLQKKIESLKSKCSTLPWTFIAGEIQDGNGNKIGNIDNVHNQDFIEFAIKEISTIIDFFEDEIWYLKNLFYEEEENLRTTISKLQKKETRSEKTIETLSKMLERLENNESAIEDYDLGGES